MKLTLDSLDLFSNHSFPRMEHGDSIVQLGSCFSTNMSVWLRKAGFEVFDNPFGVIFHPLVIADHLNRVMNRIEAKPLIQRDDIWLSYEASSAIYGLTELEIKEKIQTQVDELKVRLKAAKHLVITFGTAHGYILNDNGCVVANCHQQTGSTFTKKLFSADEMFTSWKSVIEQLQVNFPHLEITFTISPVRYVRDGIIENNQSKAALIELVRLLQSDYPKCYYFPSYEMVIDVLRDYRFYQKDLVHPNEQGIEGVWELFYANCFSEQTQDIIKQLFALRQMEAHHLLFPESEKSAEFLSNFHKKRERFLSQFVVVVW